MAERLLSTGLEERIERRFDDIETRLARIETRIETEFKHMATKAWVLSSMLGGMGIASGISVALTKLLGGG